MGYQPLYAKPRLIKELTERVQKNKLRKYLLSLEIKNLRVFQKARVNFDFPITAIVGPNGSGKSTVLMAAGCAYKNIKPSDFFANSKLDNIAGAKISFSLIDKDINPTDPIKTTISYNRRKWDRKKIPDRSVKYFGVRRTVPPAERKELFKLRSSKIEPEEEIEWNEELVKKVNWILNLNDNNYANVKFKKDKEILKASKNNITYSEFHFGAGQSSIARLIYTLENVEDYALILIEEIENGLHPNAVYRLIDYLFDVVKRKKLQILFTTHSPFALELLPKEAVWYCLDGEVYQGKIDILKLRNLDENIPKENILLVEDEFSEFLVKNILRKFEPNLLNITEFLAVGGNGSVKKYAQTFNEKIIRNKLPIKVLGIVDGDIEVEESEGYLLKLPGSLAPEKEVWDTVVNNLDTILAKLTLNLQLPTEDQDIVKKAILKLDKQDIDPHYLYHKLGEELNFISVEIVRSAFITQYLELKKTELKAFCEKKKKNY